MWYYSVAAGVTGLFCLGFAVVQWWAARDLPAPFDGWDPPLR